MHGSAQYSKEPCNHSAVGGTAFGSLKEHLPGRNFHSNEEVEIAIPEWLWVEDADFYIDGIFKLFLKWGKCISVLRDYVGKQWYLVQ
jgi:hypothetical protein